MSRVKRGVISLKRRRKVLRQTKCFRNALKSKERQAREALFHAGVHAFHDRRKKKREMRKLWQIKINAASRQSGFSYSKLIGKLKKSGIALDRKILSQLAEKHPEVFVKIIEELK
ncbi:MAG: 50S ribosomal protein L20 [Candidatus Parcubacteria bacterium]|nr:50S ribosomal protein L20 [Candidatus Parcubacteria bacterium]